MAPRSKAALERENAELQRQLAEQSTLLEESRSIISDFEERTGVSVDALDTLSPPTPDSAPQAPRKYKEPEITSDPFDPKNPFRIIDHPEDWQLSWRNPDYRNRRGWMGWIKVEWDDDIGRDLHKYLNEVPERMEAAIDNYVRRGDTILCKLQKRYYKEREARRQAVIDRYGIADGNLRRDDLRRKDMDDEESDGHSKRLGGSRLLS